MHTHLSHVVLDPGRGGSTRQVQAILVRPSDPGPWPGVVMVHEAFGLDDVLERQARRLAEAGYVVLAPDLFSAGPRLRCLVSTFRTLQAGAGPAFADLEAARQHLKADPGCTGRVGVIGFCMGGGFALLLARRGFDASSVNYGRLPEDLDAAVAGSCPIVASYGARDKGLAGAAPRLAEALRRAGVRHDVAEYPTAGHSFLNDAPNGPRVLRPLLRIAGVGPDPVAAADAWRRIEELFAEQLGSPSES
jgi:carboxymethylenebutenolidase